MASLVLPYPDFQPNTIIKSAEVDANNAAIDAWADLVATLDGANVFTVSGTAIKVKPTADPAADTKLLAIENAAAAALFSVDIEGDILGLAATLSGLVTLTRQGQQLLLKPSAAPAANTKLLEIQDAAAASLFSVDSEGDIVGLAATLSRSGQALLIKPSTDPAADTKLFELQNAAGTLLFSVDLEGDLGIGNGKILSAMIADGAITNAKVAAAAAIAKSKLAALDIVNADVAAAAAIARSKLADMLQSSVKRTAGNYTTTSTTFVDVDSTNLSITLTCSGKPVLLIFAGSGGNNSGGNLTVFDFTVDGTRLGGSNSGAWYEQQKVTDYGSPLFFAVPYTPTAGEHTFRVQWRVSAGTGTIQGADPPAWFAVVELQ